MGLTLDDMIRVVIADDNDAVRYGLSVVMELCEDMELMGEAANGKEAVALCEQLHPDLVLMDLLMPKMDGVTATQVIREHFPDIQVLVLTSGVEPEMIDAAIEAGAQGCLEKHVTLEELTDAIRAAVA